MPPPLRPGAAIARVSAGLVMITALLKGADRARALPGACSVRSLAKVLLR